jgi:hypothetical protein
MGGRRERRLTLWKLRIYGSPTGGISHASNFRSACAACPPGPESTTIATAQSTREGSAGGTAECRFKGAWRVRMKQSLVLLLQRRVPWQPSSDLAA